MNESYSPEYWKRLEEMASHDMDDPCSCGHDWGNHGIRAMHRCLATGCACEAFVAASVPSREAGPGITDSEPSTGHGIRKCRGHWHVTYAGHDLAIPGDPFATADAALDAVEMLTRGDATPAAPLASLGERPATDPPLTPEKVAQLVRVWKLNSVGFEERSSFLAANTIQMLCASHETLRAELAALRSSLQEARADSERWKFARQILCVVSVGPRTGYYLTSDPLPDSVELRSFTPDAFIDTAVRAAPLVERER